MHVTGRVWALGVWLLVLAVSSGSVWAGTVYRWTDANGGVHFSDGPPPGGGKYTTQQMTDSTRAPEQPTPGAMAGGDAAGAETPVPKGPAHVVIVEHQEVAAGDALQAFNGTVRNDGGAEAHNVRVNVRVIEPSQSEECLTQEIDVEPANLPPGATGTFDSNLSSPCFRGPTQADLRVRWE